MGMTMTDTEIVDLINQLGIAVFSNLMIHTQNYCRMAGDNTTDVRVLCTLAALNWKRTGGQVSKL